MKNIIKNTNKKGFTIVELVIVIAVIAILAGVLIPTFSSIITKANESAALQQAQASYKEAYAIAISDDGIIKDSDKDALTNSINGVQWTVANGKLTTATQLNGYTIAVDENGVVTVQKNQ